MENKKWGITGLIILFCLAGTGMVNAEEMKIAGVTFPESKVVADKTLHLNGVAMRKAMAFIKVFVGGFYLENPTNNAEDAITSEQVKHLHLHYLTSKATAKNLSEGFIKAIENANPPDLVEKQRENIDRFASWLDTDMKPGSTAESTYIPGEGLTYWINGEKRGMIQDKEFIQMYYRYNLGEKANKALRKGYLGL